MPENNYTPWEPADDDGTIRFTVEEIYNYGTTTPETPLLTGMEFIGTIPNNGISYVDSSIICCADGQCALVIEK